VATEHASGITVLRGDPQLQFIEAPFESGQVGDVIEELISLWPGYIVFNTSNGLDRWTIEVLDAVDHVLVVTTPELPALRVTRNFLVLAEAAEDESDKWQVVMNAYQGKKVLRTNDIETSIHYPIKATIAEDFSLVPTSINRGTPLVASHRKAPVAKDIVALAKQLVDLTPTFPMPQSTNGTPPFSEQDPTSQSERSGRRFPLWYSLTNAMRLTMK
jgi:pilus assembly protein CpaE